MNDTNGEALQVAETALAPLHSEPGCSPREAREVAVAELLKVAMSKAGMLQLTGDESKALMKDFPDDAFRGGAAGKENLIYIEHAHLRDRLNETLGLGQWAVVVREQWTEQTAKGICVYVRAMLIVRGCYVAEAVGDMNYYPNNASQNFGDAFEGATTAAFRRCCKQFGIGIQAWNKSWCDSWWVRKRGEGKQSSRPTAKASETPSEQPSAKSNGGNDKPPTKPAPVDDPPLAKLERFLGSQPPLGKINELLGKLPPLSPNEKKVAWETIQAYAVKRGWAWDADAKAFVQPKVPV